MLERLQFDDDFRSCMYIRAVLHFLCECSAPANRRKDFWATIPSEVKLNTRLSHIQGSSTVTDVRWLRVVETESFDFTC